MPDGMTPESPYSQFNIGGPAKLAGSEIQIPESVKSLQQIGPDAGHGLRVGMEAKNLLGPNAGNQPDRERQTAEEFKAQQESHRGSGNEIMATEGRTPKKVFEGVRAILEPSEESIIPSEVQDRWQLPRVLNAIYERRQKMDKSVEDLQRDNMIANYDPATGIATILDSDAAKYAIYKEDRLGEWTVTKRTRVMGSNNITEELTQPMVTDYYFGRKDARTGRDERKEMARACERAYLEIGARAVTGGALGLMEVYRDNLGALTETLQREKYKIPHIQALFNLPDPKELDRNIEDHTEGDRVEKAMWWYLAMMASEKKSTMIDFLKRPATKALIMPGADDAERTRYLKTMLGDYDRWVDDGSRIKDTLAEEVGRGLRGEITKWGNIPARGRGDNLDFSFGNELSYVKLIGQLSGSVSSSWAASALLQTFGEFSINGVVSFDKRYDKKTGQIVASEHPEVALELGTSNWLKGNDLGKFNVREFLTKEWWKGRPSGPKGIADKVPKMALSYFDHAQIIDHYVPVQNSRTSVVEQKPVTYSMRVAWLGDYEREVVDKATGNLVTLDPVPYTRLGGLNFDSLARDDFGNNKLLQWLAGRDERGIFVKVTNADPGPEDFSEKALKAGRKFFGINYNPLIVNQGDMRGQSDQGKVAEKVAAKVLGDLLDAWENTPNYLLNVRKNISIFRASLGRAMGGDVSNEKKISYTAFYKKLREKLALTEDSVDFNPEKQSFDNESELVDLPALGLGNKK